MKNAALLRGPLVTPSSWNLGGCADDEGLVLIAYVDKARKQTASSIDLWRSFNIMPYSYSARGGSQLKTRSLDRDYQRHDATW